jgi:hypothetical protein
MPLLASESYSTGRGWEHTAGQLGLELKRHDTTLALFKEREIDEAGGGMVCNVDGEEIRLMLCQKSVRRRR